MSRFSTINNMMQITLVRHAKSDAGDDGRSDIDRQLAIRGIRDAHHAANWLADRWNGVDLLIMSPADRAMHTAMIFSRCLSISAEKLQVAPSLYEATVSDLYKVIKALPTHVNKVMLFGHNPGFTDLINDLARDFYIDNLPTTGIVSFDLPITSWRETTSGSAVHLYHYFPKLPNT